MRKFSYIFGWILFALSISIIGAFIIKVSIFLIFHVSSFLSILCGLFLLGGFIINAIRISDDLI